MAETMEQMLTKLGNTFHEFKEANDTRLKEIENKGAADPLLIEKVDAINAAMTGFEERIANYSELQDQVEDLEARMSRPRLGGDDAAVIEANNARMFFAMARGADPETITIDDETMESYQNYKKALWIYVRRGDAINQDIRNALSVGSDPDGGYWVMPDTSGRLITLITETSPIRQIAAVQNIGTDTLEGFNDLDVAASGWVGEEQARPETGTPQIGKWSIPIREQYAMPKTTQKMLDDAFNDPEAWLERKVAEQLARTENTAFVNGDGILRPRGFLTYPAGTPSKSAWPVIQQINSGLSGGFAATDPGDALIDLIFSLKSIYRTGARWVMSRFTLAEVRKLKDGQGNYLWERDFSVQQGSTLLGYPITEAEDMPAIAADSLSIGFGNWSIGYQIVDRIGIRILRDPLTDKGFVKFYTTKRTSGDVVNFEALKLFKFAV